MHDPSLMLPYLKENRVLRVELSQASSWSKDQPGNCLQLWLNPTGCQPPCPMSSPANQRWTRYFCLKILPVQTHSECGYLFKTPSNALQWLISWTLLLRSTKSRAHVPKGGSFPTDVHNEPRMQAPPWPLEKCLARPQKFSRLFQPAPLRKFPEFDCYLPCYTPKKFSSAPPRPALKQKMLPRASLQRTHCSCGSMVGRSRI